MILTVRFTARKRLLLLHLKRWTRRLDIRGLAVVKEELRYL